MYCRYFDRDGSGGIDLSEFSHALVLMGFQFTDIQTLALFARYDQDASGFVDYREFVNKVMECDFKSLKETVAGQKLGRMIDVVANG